MLMNRERQFNRPFAFSASVISSGIAYYILCYQTARENFLQVISLFIVLFVAYVYCVRYLGKDHLVYLVSASLVFRLMLLFSVPALSDDVYRFIWDGKLLANGISPYSNLPSEIIQKRDIIGVTPALYAQLNSPNYYAIYPPVMQSIFWLGAKLFPTDIPSTIAFFKSVILVADIGIFYLMKRMLEKLGLPVWWCLWYILNPLVIVELTGNAHFESVMIFFLLLAFLLLLNSHYRTGAVMFGFGIATKIIPVLFMPVIFYYLGWKRGLYFSLIAGITTLAQFALFLDASTINHLMQSAHLFIRHFEFNASIYYLVKAVAIWINGYNMISIVGPTLFIIAGVMILLLSVRAKIKHATELFTCSLFIIFTWYLFATTVHPWYLTLTVALSVFTNYRFPIVWSFTALLSYSAYQFKPVHEIWWLIAAGYLCVLVFAFKETRRFLSRKT
jgi:alpha-1,6-mannosyltransferase